jgi:spore germination cell wall hydrolase CwlJ-like protein
MTKRTKPRVVREQVGLPDRSLQFKNTEGYRVFFKVFISILSTFVIIAGINRPDRQIPMQYVEIAKYDRFIDDTEISCLAKNMYFEARNEGTAGVLAVSNVVLNRVKSELYPNTICGVIEDAKISQWWLKEKGKKIPIKNMCQFSWYCDGKPDDITDEYTYNQLHKLAESLVTSNFKILLDITDGALYYHADYVKPKWSRKFERTVKIGRHIFYKRR